MKKKKALINRSFVIICFVLIFFAPEKPKTAFNDAQQEACFEYVSRSMLVLAGAAAEKPGLSPVRSLNLVRECGL